MKSLKIIDKLLEKIHQYDEWYLTEMEVEQIKQDLEVLEILRKHLWIEDDYVCLSDYLNNNYYEEHFHKVKQWLEENDE